MVNLWSGRLPCCQLWITVSFEHLLLMAGQAERPPLSNLVYIPTQALITSSHKFTLHPGSSWTNRRTGWNDHSSFWGSHKLCLASCPYWLRKRLSYPNFHGLTVGVASWFPWHFVAFHGFTCLEFELLFFRGRDVCWPSFSSKPQRLQILGVHLIWRTIEMILCQQQLLPGDSPLQKGWVPLVKRPQMLVPLGM